MEIRRNLLERQSIIEYRNRLKAPDIYIVEPAKSKFIPLTKNSPKQRILKYHSF